MSTKNIYNALLFKILIIRYDSIELAEVLQLGMNSNKRKDYIIFLVLGGIS